MTISHSSSQYRISVHDTYDLFSCENVPFSSWKQLFSASSTIELKQKSFKQKIIVQNTYNGTIEQSLLKWNERDCYVWMHVAIYCCHVTTF